MSHPRWKKANVPPWALRVSEFHTRAALVEALYEAWVVGDAIREEAPDAEERFAGWVGGLLFRRDGGAGCKMFWPSGEDERYCVRCGWKEVEHAGAAR